MAELVVVGQVADHGDAGQGQEQEVDGGDGQEDSPIGGNYCIVGGFIVALCNFSYLSTAQTLPLDAH